MLDFAYNQVSAKGQVVIPAELRRLLGMHPGSQVEIRLQGRGVYLAPVREKPVSTVEEGFGMIKVKAKPGRKDVLDFDVAEAMRQMRKE